MSKKRGRIKTETGDWVEGTIVEVTESTERFTHITLEDGAILKAKVAGIEALRIDGQTDQDGNPRYVLKSQTIVAVVKAPKDED